MVFISEVRLEGLETLDYLDNMHDRERFTEQGDALTFESEIDRVYLNSKDVVAIFDHERKRTFLIKKEGLPDVGKIQIPKTLTALFTKNPVFNSIRFSVCCSGMESMGEESESIDGFGR